MSPARSTTRPERIDEGVLEQCALALRVLAHPHRLKIVELLMEARHSVGELARELDLAPNAVSQHLNQMRAHGLLGVVRKGRTAYYRVANPNAANIIRCIRKHGHGRD